MVGVDHRAVQSLLASDAVHALETGVLGDFVIRVVEVEVSGVAVRERREHALVAETARPALVLLVASHREGDRERLGQGCVFTIKDLLQLCVVQFLHDGVSEPVGKTQEHALRLVASRRHVDAPEADQHLVQRVDRLEALVDERAVFRLGVDLDVDLS